MLMKEREKVLLNPHIDNFLIAVFTEVSKDGLDKVITKQNIKNLQNHTIEMGEIEIDLKQYKVNNIENILAFFTVYLIYS